MTRVPKLGEVSRWRTRAQSPVAHHWMLNSIMNWCLSNKTVETAEYLGSSHRRYKPDLNEKKEKKGVQPSKICCYINIMSISLKRWKPWLFQRAVPPAVSVLLLGSFHGVFGYYKSYSLERRPLGQNKTGHKEHSVLSGRCSPSISGRQPRGNLFLHSLKLDPLMWFALINETFGKWIFSFGFPCLGSLVSVPAIRASLPNITDRGSGGLRHQTDEPVRLAPTFISVTCLLLIAKWAREVEQKAQAQMLIHSFLIR